MTILDGGQSRDQVLIHTTFRTIMVHPGLATRRLELFLVLGKTKQTSRDKPIACHAFHSL